MGGEAFETAASEADAGQTRWRVLPGRGQSSSVANTPTRRPEYADNIALGRVSKVFAPYPKKAQKGMPMQKHGSLYPTGRVQEATPSAEAGGVATAADGEGLDAPGVAD